MAMNKIEEVEPYQAKVSKETLKKWNGTVRVWSEPMSAVEGSKVLDEIQDTIDVTVFEEQKDVYGSLSQRAHIRYGDGKEGWVLWDAIATG
ncbi:MAG: hypothetical protein IIC81_09920 [Chloroflexi bacterium]|nr:hypothetical protein [Chloroflexota bacterium]MCH8088389.1 hypothetical protein [Chloroflexota bacterium]